MILGRKPIGTVAYMGGVAAVLEEFCWSWGQMVQYNHEIWLQDDIQHYVHYSRVKYSDHAPARNALCASMLGDWIVMLDTDHEFEPDIVHRLVRTADECGVDVLSGIYRYKTHPYSPVCFLSNAGVQPVVALPTDAKVIEVHAFGAGVLFIRRKALTLISSKTNKSPFDRIEGWSEDHSFCQRCEEVGVKRYIAPNIEANHLRVVPVTGSDSREAGLDGAAVSQPIECKGYK